jgi:uncharacterized hydrophobic protein (TIGR00341 family)
LRIVEVIADRRHAKTLIGMAKFYGAKDQWWAGEGEDGRCSIRMLVSDERRQALIDALQDLFKAQDRARILVQPVDAVLTHAGQADRDAQETKAAAVAATREELYSQIAKGAQLDSNFILLTLLSTLVAAIGLVENDVAVVIGAMVIAPLLGPNIALAFGTSLGDKTLSWRAARTNAAGLGLALVTSIAIALILPIDLGSPELQSRTSVDLAGVVLGLASGAAAVLSLTTGLSSTLVGVMVAVALLPPTATMGMMLGQGHWNQALGALLLLTVNVVCVLLAAKLVFLFRGVRPRSWTERNRARQSMRFYLALWALLLAILIGVILLRSLGPAALSGASLGHSTRADPASPLESQGAALWESPAAQRSDSGENSRSRSSALSAPAAAPPPSSMASASACLRAWSSATRCSTVPSVSNLYTKTGLSWPMRCARSVA